MKLDLEKKTIMVVENSAMMRTILREMLVQFGVRDVVLVANAEEALDTIKSRVFDAIILDFFLGKRDGGDFARLLRRATNNPNRATPILLISALPEHEKVIKARDCGIDEMLAKPISPKNLYHRLHTIFTKPRPFVNSKNYIGPCRRRQQLPIPGDVERRQSAANRVELSI